MSKRAKKGEPRTWTDPAPHKDGFLKANGIRLNYLDWGGSGPVLILIHGFSDNPHIFDDLAPSFTDSFRVIAYARRGHGKSEANGPYDNATMTEDLRGLMDNLRIPKASLAGWSMGGNEITSMAGAHPERVDRIVYLDAGYDWADRSLAKAFKTLPVPLRTPTSALKSLDAYRRYNHTMWFASMDDLRPLEAYFRDLVLIHPDGTLRERMSNGVMKALWSTLTTFHKDYTRVRLPALAIYAHSFVPVRHGDPTQLAKNLAWERKFFVKFRKSSIERIRCEIPGTKIVRVPGTHQDFVFTSRDRVVSVMRRFLLEPN